MSTLVTQPSGIVTSLLGTDLYKLTMLQALLTSHPDADGEYTFLCRSKTAYPLAELVDEVNAELDHLCTLSFSAEELARLRTLRFLKSHLIDFLSIFRFQRRFIEVTAEGNDLRVVAKGPIIHVMGFEIFVLQIVNELYFRRLPEQGVLDEARRRLYDKIELVKGCPEAMDPGDPFLFFDFGLRRRYSSAWQTEVATILAKELPLNFRGTSNVQLAFNLGLTPIGTMAHEYLQAYQAFGFRLADSLKAALEGWVQEFRGDLGYALTDVVGLDAFLRYFDLYFAKLFDGLRHDSGDPFLFGERCIDHYRSLRIDPLSKILTFSDSLDFVKALALFTHFRKRIRTNYGIGTFLMNDTPHAPLNIVMKLTRCNGQPVAKLSDSPGKTMCQDQEYVAYLRKVFSVPVPA
jgi:nicotinate phosphoribosyltransferase